MALGCGGLVSRIVPSQVPFLENAVTNLYTIYTPSLLILLSIVV
jgi:hypothetical protein